MTKPKAVLPPGEDIKSKKPRLKKGDAGNAAGCEKSYIGQEVHGIVDGSFDAGYLLTVKVGDSPLVFRGMVFEPGMLVPLSKTNDIAPTIPATGRNQQIKSPTAMELPPSTGGPFAARKGIADVATDQRQTDERQDELEGELSNMETVPSVEQVDTQPCTVPPVEAEAQADGVGDPDAVSKRAEQTNCYQNVESANDSAVAPCCSLMNLNAEVQEFVAQSTANSEEQPPDSR